MKATLNKSARATKSTIPFDYPKSLNENRRFRALLLQRAEEDEILQAAIKEKCTRDLLFWIDNFAWTKDPRRIPDILPFVSYDFQGPTLLAIEKAIDEQEDLLLEKSRDMGASWMVLYVLCHKWLFEPGSDFRVGSRKEDFVDIKGDIDTLFEKVRFCIEKQPMWLMPERFDWREHSSYMKLINPELGNTIMGESANASFATGGRRKAVVLDEFSKWDKSIAKTAWTSTGDVSPCRIPISTPLGSGNKFAVLAQGTVEKINKLTLHWTLHPSKAEGAYYLDGSNRIDIEEGKAFNLWKKLRGKPAPSGMKGGLVRSPWYDKECERRSQADVAQELDIDYLASGYPFFDQYKLDLQRVWPEFIPKEPGMKLPYGWHQRGKLIKRQMKTVFVGEAQHGWLKVYEHPKEGYEYILGSDTAEGLPKGDESVAVVREKISRNVVAVLNGRIAPEELAERSFLLESYYNGCLNIPENNNHGYTTAKILEDLGSNLYYTKRDETYKHAELRETAKRGWSTTSTTRPLMLDELEEEVRNSGIELRDGDLIAEFKTFVKNANTGKPEADGDFLDDLVIACAIAGVGITHHPYNPGKRINTDLQAQRVYETTKKRKNAGISYGRKK